MSWFEQDRKQASCRLSRFGAARWRSTFRLCEVIYISSSPELGFHVAALHLPLLFYSTPRTAFEFGIQTQIPLSAYTALALSRPIKPDTRIIVCFPETRYHFIGDLHQPLHNEDVAKGGNEIQVRWQRRDHNLHAVWDALILEKMTEHLDPASSTSVAKLWAGELVGEITGGKYAADKQTWLADFDPSDAHATAMAWSREANAYVCKNGEKSGFSCS
ncbi:Phospholipase C/P1 nuclease, core [Metarhizium album ARSEF 1941]|uniref:Phospholipase C/P1 nuclease, core n=1 Tax=Metarhizium album (strain ARSEF 1941) TaxID=1081103 RepID=A0A0B2X7S7_METAS|nr:Phospholipase C/P1 nuclease, core [Metarhizium album ARSEF 1941]KHO01336.1 Phospholipase C/P1 nuclease, core [Metarhizium album ARSEF 1941]